MLIEKIKKDWETFKKILKINTILELLIIGGVQVLVALAVLIPGIEQMSFALFIALFLNRFVVGVNTFFFFLKNNSTMRGIFFGIGSVIFPMPFGFLVTGYLPAKSHRDAVYIKQNQTPYAKDAGFFARLID